jgi:DNA-binding NtrC family response regulator
MTSLPRQRNRHILIVDDEPDVLDFLRIYLESLGWNVTAAPSTSEAFRALHEQPYFLVISDIAMPDMDGYEFMSKLQEMLLPSQMAVMTGFGYNPNHTLVKIHRTLRYPCLFKPFNRKKVAEVVQQAWETYNRDIPASGAEATGG